MLSNSFILCCVRVAFLSSVLLSLTVTNHFSTSSILLLPGIPSGSVTSASRISGSFIPAFSSISLHILTLGLSVLGTAIPLLFLCIPSGSFPVAIFHSSVHSVVLSSNSSHIFSSLCLIHCIAVLDIAVSSLLSFSTSVSMGVHSGLFPVDFFCSSVISPALSADSFMIFNISSYCLLILSTVEFDSSLSGHCISSTHSRNLSSSISLLLFEIWVSPAHLKSPFMFTITIPCCICLSLSCTEYPVLCFSSYNFIYCTSFSCNSCSVTARMRPFSPSLALFCLLHSAATSGCVVKKPHCSPSVLLLLRGISLV